MCERLGVLVFDRGGGALQHMLEHSCSSGRLATFEANSSSDDDSGGVFMNSRGTQALTLLRFIDKTLP